MGGAGCKCTPAGSWLVPGEIKVEGWGARFMKRLLLSVPSATGACCSTSFVLRAQLMVCACLELYLSLPAFSWSIFSYSCFSCWYLGWLRHKMIRPDSLSTMWKPLVRIEHL